MSINNITNGESGLSVRNKLNKAISVVNLGVTTGATIENGIIQFNTNTEINSYDVNLISGGLSGIRSFGELGFEIELPPSSATTISQDVYLPQNVTVRYTSPLIIGSGYTVTVPNNTNLIIITGNT